MGKHLIFYDGECGLCDQAVQFILARDKKRLFDFAPLQGKTAERWLKLPPSVDTVVLIEDYQTNPKLSIRSKAAFRSLYHLGGIWTVPGLLSFLPSFLFDWGYRIVARNRKAWFSQDHCVIPDPKERQRFLP